jgi:hypothetical protein
VSTIDTSGKDVLHAYRNGPGQPPSGMVVDVVELVEVDVVVLVVVDISQTHGCGCTLTLKSK